MMKGSHSLEGLLVGYRSALDEALESTVKERDALASAAALIAESLANGGVLHVFGSGHSQLVAKEIVGRSGSFIPVNEIIDRTEDMAERIEGVGTKLLEYHHSQYQLLPGEVVIVISNSGVNPLPIEIALGARKRGLAVAAITNVAQSRSLTSRHSSGKRLFECADVVVHNHSPFGEAAVAVPGMVGKVGTMATVIGAYLINSLLIATAAHAVSHGLSLPLYVSENAGDDAAASRNEELRARYQGRLRRFGV